MHGLRQEQATDLKQKMHSVSLRSISGMLEQVLLCMEMLQFKKTNSPGWLCFDNNYITISAL
jgi:hypothetical protein